VVRTAGAPAGRRTRRRAADPERREEILEAALVLFHERGYDATGIQDIAAQVGMLKGSLYYHIRSKEEILQHLIGRTYQDGLEVLRESLAVDGPLPVKLRAVVERHTRFVLENAAGVNIALKELPALSAEERRGLDRIRATYVEELRAVIEAGMRAGSLRATLDPDVVVRAMIGTVNGACMWYLRERGEPPSDLPEQLAELLLAGLSNEVDG
jgi:TetR/AcrR family transcriptional regulator, cholesterol catabolism regulator